jgi:hypothetical protein
MNSMRLSTKAKREIGLYQLHSNQEYISACERYTASLNARKEKYGKLARDIPTRNMLKALRMLPLLNSPEDWARLHITEALTRDEKVERSIKRSTGQLMKY